MKRLAVLILLGAVISFIALKPRPPVTLHGRAMGCSWTLACKGHPPENLRQEVVTVLEHWEQVLSQWRPDSDLSRHNRGEPATPELSRVLDLAESLHQQTGSAFDPRLLENVHRAGFGPAGHGYDLSAIGKGFAIDRVGERLQQLGIDHFVFELGGEVLAGKGQWKTSIESPHSNTPAKSITLSRQAIATSGNYHQYRTSSDGLISHILDPRSGEPVIRPPSSVTVFAPDCATADAWATALFVLGPEASPENAPDFNWNQAELNPPHGN